MNRIHPRWAATRTRPRSLKRQRSGLRIIKREREYFSLSFFTRGRAGGGTAFLRHTRSTHHLGPLPKPKLQNRHGESAGLASLLRIQRAATMITNLVTSIKIAPLPRSKIWLKKSGFITSSGYISFFPPAGSVILLAVQGASFSDPPCGHKNSDLR